MQRDKREGRPANKSPINLDSNFHGNFELSAVAVRNQNVGSKVLTDVAFCETNEGRKIFEGFPCGREENPLKALLKILEIKLSRTDSALNFHKASRMDKFPNASKAGKKAVY